MTEYEAATVPPWGWRGTFKEFRSLTLRVFLHSLLIHRQNRWSDAELSLWQVNSWIREFELFQQLLEGVCTQAPMAEQAIICFEFELQLEVGHRPDILLHLPDGIAFLIECKYRSTACHADIHQLRDYAHKLRLFHSVRELHPVLLLLKEHAKESTPTFSNETTIIDASEQGIAHLCRLITSSTPLQATFPQLLPVDVFTPQSNVVASVAKVIENLIPLTFEGAALEENIMQRVKKAQASAEHALLIVSGELHSGKSACALRTVGRTSNLSISSLYLTGDEPFPKDIRKYWREIGTATGKTELSSLARSVSQFVRHATRLGGRSSLHFIAFDNPDNCIFSSAGTFPLPEPALIDFADRQDWGVLVVFVSYEDEFWSGKFTESIKHWFFRLLLHDRKHPWNFVCARPFGVSEDAAAASGILLTFDSQFYLGRRPPPECEIVNQSEVVNAARSYFNYDSPQSEPGLPRWMEIAWRSFQESEQIACPTEDIVWSRSFLAHKLNERGVAFVHEIAFRGRLNDVPPSLLTWDILSLEENELGRTPIRHAAKYGWIDQIPPAAVASHFIEVSRIAREAVENSRVDGRSERRTAVTKWLIRVALVQAELSSAPPDQLLAQLEQLISEAVACGTALRVPESSTIPFELTGEDSAALFQRYFNERNEPDLELGIYIEYITQLLKIAPTVDEAPLEVPRGIRRMGRGLEGIEQINSQLELF